MATTKILMIRVDSRQHEFIKNRMASQGYRTLSQYARDCMLRDDLSTLSLLQEIKKIIEGANNDKGKKN